MKRYSNRYTVEAQDIVADLQLELCVLVDDTVSGAEADCLFDHIDYIVDLFAQAADDDHLQDRLNEQGYAAAREIVAVTAVCSDDPDALVIARLRALYEVSAAADGATTADFDGDPSFIVDIALAAALRLRRGPVAQAWYAFALIQQALVDAEAEAEDTAAFIETDKAAAAAINAALDADALPRPNAPPGKA